MVYITQSARMPATTARIFSNGRSQAVRLPKEFRFKGKEVRISREGERVVLSPRSKAASSRPRSWADFFAHTPAMPPDFMQERPANSKTKPRESVARLFET